MENATQNPQKILIYGNNLDAWLTFSGLTTLLELPIRRGLLDLQILLPPTESCPDCVVGHPEDKRFFPLLGVSEADLFSLCEAQFNLGNTYTTKQGYKAVHPFGACGFSYQGLAFTQLWLRLQQRQATAPAYHEFSPAAVCAQLGRFCHPPNEAKNLLATMDYALNFKASKLVKLLRSRARSAAVHEGEMTELVFKNKTDSLVQAVRTTSGDEHRADLFIDVSQARSLQRQQVDQQQSEIVGQLNILYAREEGVNEALVSGELNKSEHLWYSQSDLYKERHYCAHGFCALDEQHCLQNWKKNAGLDVEKQGSAQWQVERIAKAWVGNVLALGQGLYRFPLLALSPVFLLHRQLQQVLKLLPGELDRHLCAAEYNRFYSGFIKNVYEVQAVHSVLPLAEDAKQEDIGHSGSADLRHRITLFEERGRVAFDPRALLSVDEWASLLIALGVKPKACDPLLDKYNFDALEKKLLAGATMLKKMAAQVPPLHLYRAKLIEHLKQ